MSILNEFENCPVFVHSLFRAGSTYIFSVFRRSSAGYWCYQEPMSEFVLPARNERESMLVADDNLAKVLRHPDMKGAYYSELYSVFDECITKLDESYIYDGYFATTPEQAGVPYLTSLISSAKGRPLIQECRTSSRIGVVKSALGGCHIYLWRNPWDQWWSYKVDHYFDDANQMCINGAHHPDIISRLIDEVGFNGLAEGNIFQKFSWFFQNRLSPENSYLVFYVLWFLGLKEGLEHSELKINIDRLSDSLEYRNDVTLALEEKGIDGLDFSDCSVPQAVYGAKDRAFFQNIEQRAHGLLLLSGTSQNLIDEIVALRNVSEPLVWHRDHKPEADSNLIRDAERARELVLAFEKRAVDARIDHERQLLVERERYNSIEARFLAADAQVEASKEKKAEIEGEYAKLEAKCLELADMLVAADAKIDVALAKSLGVEGKVASKEVEFEHAKLEAKCLELADMLVAAHAKTEAALAKNLGAEGKLASKEVEFEHEKLEVKCLELADKLIAADAKTAAADAKSLEFEGKLASIEVEFEHAKLESKALTAELERQIQELLTSTSWRLTRPLRVLSGLIKGQGINLKASPLLKIKHRLKSFISHLLRKAIANPRIKEWAVGFLSRRPVLKTRLKRIAWGMQQSQVDAVSPSIATVDAPISYKQKSTIKKKGNGDELKSPLESFFY